MTHVDWKPYPETHPAKDGFYLVTIKNYDLNPDYEGDDTQKYLDTFSLEVWELEFELKYEKDRAGDGFACGYDEEIIAWAEKPLPYQPEAINERKS